MKKNKIINKQDYKKETKCCIFCKEKEYNRLQVHRIIPGSEYRPSEVVTLCANCHTDVHAGKFVIDRWYPSTNGDSLRVFVNGEEKFLQY
jgi:hypothetical protein